jgi:hypothetical protein
LGLLGDIFEGDQGAKAANATRSFLNLTKEQNMPVIQQGYVDSTGAIRSGSNQARDALGQGYNDGRSYLNQGANDAFSYAGQGAANAMAHMEQGKSAYTPLAGLGTKYGAGTDLYMDALGARGADGNARASAAFMPSMAYNFNMKEGLEAINRRRAAGGMLDSGNADRDAQEYGSGLASREQAAWMDRLAGLVNPELAATSGAATGMGNLSRDQAALAQQAGVTNAGIASQRGTMLADLANKYGTNVANVGMTEGRNLSDLGQAQSKDMVALSMGLAPMFAGTYKQEADARTAGSANLMNLGIEGAKMIAGGGFGNPFASGGMGGSGNGSMFPSSSFLSGGMSWGD